MKITIEDVGVETLVVVKAGDTYEKLAGWVTEVRTNKDDFVTENEIDAEIEVSLSETYNMEETHPNLNGTGISDLVMDIEELIFFPNGKDHIGYDSDGKEYNFIDSIHPSFDYMLHNFE